MSKDYFTLISVVLVNFLFLFFYFSGIVELTNRIIMYCPNNVVEHDYSQDMCEYQEHDYSQDMSVYQEHDYSQDMSVYQEHDYSQDMCPIDNNLYCPYYRSVI